VLQSERYRKRRDIGDFQLDDGIGLRFRYGNDQALDQRKRLAVEYNWSGAHLHLAGNVQEVSGIRVRVILAVLCQSDEAGGSDQKQKHREAEIPHSSAWRSNTRGDDAPLSRHFVRNLYDHSQ
jgi:hypothetical protein